MSVPSLIMWLKIYFMTLPSVTAFMALNFLSYPKGDIKIILSVWKFSFERELVVLRLCE
jgi:hypothetical protein